MSIVSTDIGSGTSFGNNFNISIFRQYKVNRLCSFIFPHAKIVSFQVIKRNINYKSGSFCYRQWLYVTNSFNITVLGHQYTNKLHGLPIVPFYYNIAAFGGTLQIWRQESSRRRSLKSKLIQLVMKTR